MLHMMDTVIVAAEDARRYLDLFEAEELPASKARGMNLAACWHTPMDIGEDVTVTTIWSVRDWAHWNDLRKATVLDQKFFSWLDKAQPMWRGGNRRFYLGASFSPM